MPVADISHLSDEAAVWIFGIAPAVSDASAMLRQVDDFLAGWAAHNVPVLSARELRGGRFLIVAVEKTVETSGCSIDRLFGLVRQFEREFGVSMLDPGRIFYRDAAGAIAEVARSAFRDVATEETVVFDPTVETLGAVRSGAWERPARESWHASLLRRSA